MNDDSKHDKIPRSTDKDYSHEMAEARRDFLFERTGKELKHVGQFSIEPPLLPGNVENFIGVAQIPIGLAGPLLVNGEHARGDFFVPLATTEGTLVASYNRGMKLLFICIYLWTISLCFARRRSALSPSGKSFKFGRQKIS